MFAFFNEVSCESCSFCNGFFSDTFDCSFPVSFPVYDCVHYYFIFVLPTRNAISRPKRVKFFQCLNETFHTKNDKKCLLVWTKKKTSQLSSALSEKCARKMCSTPKKRNLQNMEPFWEESVQTVARVSMCWLMESVERREIIVFFFRLPKHGRVVYRMKIAFPRAGELCTCVIFVPFSRIPSPALNEFFCTFKWIKKPHSPRFNVYASIDFCSLRFIPSVLFFFALQYSTVRACLF